MKKLMMPTKDRPTTMISLRIPVDIVEKLKRIAPAKGMSGYQALIKYYVGKGLREDLRLFQQIESTEKVTEILTQCGLKADQVDEVWRALQAFHPPNEQQTHEPADRSPGEE